MENEGPFEWFYVVFQAVGFVGCIVLPQHKIVGGGKNPDGMNIASAYRLINAAHGVPSIILHWRQISKRRADEFEIFISGQGAPDGSSKGRHLSLVKKE